MENKKKLSEKGGLGLTMIVRGEVVNTEFKGLSTKIPDPLKSLPDAGEATIKHMWTLMRSYAEWLDMVSARTIDDPTRDRVFSWLVAIQAVEKKLTRFLQINGEPPVVLEHADAISTTLSEQLVSRESWGKEVG